MLQGFGFLYNGSYYESTIPEMRSAVCGIVRSALSTSWCRTWCSWSRLSHQSHSTVFALSSGKGKCGK